MEGLQSHIDKAHPSKRTKVESEDGTADLSRCAKGSSKFTNDSLPAGCQEGNLWRGVFITLVAHWHGGHVDPWSIDPQEQQCAMQVIWDEIYRDKFEHSITLGGPVYYVVS